MAFFLPFFLWNRLLSQEQLFQIALSNPAADDISFV